MMKRGKRKGAKTNITINLGGGKGGKMPMGGPPPMGPPPGGPGGPPPGAGGPPPGAGGPPPMPGMKKGGKAKKMAKGGGIESKGKTRGRMC